MPNATSLLSIPSGLPTCLNCPSWYMAIFGATGCGKTNLLGQLFSQLIHNGGCAFIDPNGDAAEEFLSLIGLSL
ncbi:MAG: helicase HerA domain-containing protein, partial [Planctomycetota bacterium]